MRVSSASGLVGATPPAGARPVSLATRDYFLRHLQPDIGVVIAVSGGADSTALAIAASDVAHRSGVKCAVAIVDHGMREESASEAATVAGRLRRAGISEVAVLSGHVAGLPREGPARDLRHGLLEQFATQWARKNKVSAVDILFGHTMDDQAETVLMRLGRGASPRALSAMRERAAVRSSRNLPLHRGRPLLVVRRRDTEEFCRCLGLDWVEDPSNSLEGTWTASGGAPLPRTAVRHLALPELSRALGQDVTPALARVAALLAEDEDALGADADRVLSVSLAEEDRGEDRLAVAVGPLQGSSPAVRKRAYLRAWERMVASPARPRNSGEGGSPSRAQLEAVDQLVMNKADGSVTPTGKRVELSGRVCVQRRRGIVEFTRPTPYT